MTRGGLLIALTLAAATGLVFGLVPELDIAVSRLFYAPGVGFPWGTSAVVDRLRDANSLLVALLAAPAVLAPLIKLWRPQARLVLRGRAVVLMIATLVIGPLLVTNLLLKEHWGRPRPRDIAAFGGQARFVPWWDPRGTCAENCSFVAGEPTAAAWTFAPAALAPPPWRAAAYAGALAFTAAVGLGRIAVGGHFLSDVLLGGALMFLIVWLVHAALYRWRGHPSDAAIEAPLVRLAAALRRRPDDAGRRLD